MMDPHRLFACLRGGVTSRVLFRSSRRCLTHQRSYADMPPPPRIVDATDNSSDTKPVVDGAVETPHVPAPAEVPLDECILPPKTEIIVDARLSPLARRARRAADKPAGIRSHFAEGGTFCGSRDPVVKRVVMRQAASFDKRCVRLDEAVRGELRKTMSLAMFSGINEHDAETVADRLYERATLHAFGNEELLVAFGLPVGSPDHPYVCSAELHLLMLTAGLLEQNLMTLARLADSRLARFRLARLQQKLADRICGHMKDRFDIQSDSSFECSALALSARSVWIRFLHRLEYALQSPTHSDELLAGAIFAQAQAPTPWVAAQWELRHIRRQVEWIRFHVALFEALPSPDAFLGCEWHYVSVLDPAAFPTTSAEVLEELQAHAQADPGLTDDDAAQAAK
eukprot:TRINITY_DN7269_c0_g1_i1.p1 TRINITY_DN7269_c0_g1~~TRINITY_DN7269_c0_g1_i1.p1  ORF type:complete len:397 (-),score=95.37 TRINITY_DN7269_c0_g1_i1:58-1248(-)